MMRKAAVIPFVLLVGIGVLIVSAGSVSTVVENRPYGVRDGQREDYERILESIERKKATLKAAQANASPNAKVEVPEQIFNFGYIDPFSVESTHRFEVRNVGTEDLVLQRSETTCKCTVAELDQPVVKPGGSTFVKVIWNAGSDVGEELEQIATIATNDANMPLIEFTVRGVVATPWTVQGPITADGSVPEGQPMVGSQLLYSQVHQNMVVLETESSSENVTVEAVQAEAEELRIVDAVSGFRLIATHQSVSNKSKFSETVRVHVADPASGKSEWLEVPFSGRYRNPVAFFGPEIRIGSGLDLGLIEIGSDQEWSFGARFRTDPPVQNALVKAVKPDSLSASIRPVRSLPGTFRVTVKLSDQAEPERFRGNPQGFVEIADASNPDVSNWMPLYGQIIEPVQVD